MGEGPAKSIAVTSANAAGREKKKKDKWEEPEHFGQTNRIIMRNYQILKPLCNEKGYPVSNGKLRDEGFEFDL